MAKLVNLIGYIACVSLFFVQISIFAQQNGLSVHGQILDKKTNEPLIGATISNVDDKTGTASDVEGKFSLNVKSFPVKISVSYLGYKTSETIVPTSTGALKIELTEDANLLDEIVVVGYGTQKRKELTGAVSSVSKSILEHPTLSIDALLGGAIAGVNVAQASGQPGAPSSIRIRGGNSVHAKNDPLYVIDGFIFYSDNSSTKVGLDGIEGNLNPLSTINPSDIESMEILKDVSATAIYGSRGANGVILVTTKKGVRGTNNVSYQYSIGQDTPAKKLDLLNASQWARMQKDYFFNKGRWTDEDIAQLGEGYDWQDAVLKTGSTQTHELSISGGNDNTRYLVSGNYTDQKGIILNSGFERYNGRVNLDKNLTNKFSVGITANVGKSTQNSLTIPNAVNYNGPFSKFDISNSLTYALYMPPVVPVYNADGSYNYHNPFEYGDFVYDGRSVNPVSDLQNSSGQTINSTFLGNFYANYLITEGLTAKINAGTNVSYVTQNFFAPKSSAIGLRPFGIGGIGNKQQTVSQIEYTLNYNKQFNDIHHIDLLGGYTSQNTKWNYATNLTSDFTNEELGFNNLADGSVPYPPDSDAKHSELYSLIGRVNYSLLNRYNLTATVRADKSTRFAQGHLWGYFPSVGLSWNLNEEAFLTDVRSLSNLKLRLTCGTVGNQEIGEYEYAQIFRPSRYADGVAYKQTNLGNPNLKWESTTQYNVGVDVGVFNNRLSFTADAYYKKTYDLLLKVPIDPLLGGGTQLENVGNLTNQGVEFSGNLTLLDHRDLKWAVSANVAKNINKIVSIGDEALIELEDTPQILKVGEPLGSFYGVLFDGIVQEGEDVSKLPTTTHSPLKPGDIKLKDVSGPNGVPDGYANDQYDRVPLGSNQPDITYGFSTTLNYRKFDLFISTQGAAGNKIYNRLRQRLELPNDIYNASAALLDSWTPENRSNTLPSLANLSNNRTYGYLDSRYIEDASFLRLKNITLGYTLKPRFLNPAQLRVFASAENLLVITGYKGYDPEVAEGVDLGIYPSARTFSLGARITF